MKQTHPSWNHTKLEKVEKKMLDKQRSTVEVLLWYGEDLLHLILETFRLVIVATKMGVLT